MPITIYTIFQSFWIIMGFWCISRLAWMVIYEALERDVGEKYLKGTLNKKWKKYLEEKWHDYHLKK